MTAIPKRVWRDDYENGQQTGEGVTRCSDPSAGLYWVNVWMRGAAPMASCVRATSAEQAAEFCRNRHPNAVLIQLAKGE